MNHSKLLACLFAAGVLSAQTPGEEMGKIQVFVDSTSFQAYDLASVGGYTFSDKAKEQVGVGLRLIMPFPEAPNWDLELGGRFPEKSKFQLNATGGGASVNNTSTDLHYSWWGVGVGYSLRPSAAFEVGFHLEGRGENLKVAGTTYATNAGIPSTYPAAQSVTFWRPWARISAEFAIPTQKTWTPYFGADVSGALKKTDQKGIQLLTDSIHDDTTLKSMAPRWNASVYAGLRF
ncbi:hypothetical protein [Geothrix sp. 21YS21S-4]|uniref:hypothetical protein n=1 Tax=Geothrix sp. 21YS21S-4 TaxID=3068889 RepID=UPI0027BA961D|nr:hypothetical protein [Geothrix sp. 21YS21S-4]